MYTYTLYTYTKIYRYIHMCIYAYTYANMYVHIHIYIYIYTYVCMHACMYVHMCVCWRAGSVKDDQVLPPRQVLPPVRPPTSSLTSFDLLALLSLQVLQKPRLLGFLTIKAKAWRPAPTGRERSGTSRRLVRGRGAASWWGGSCCDFLRLGDVRLLAS